MSDPGSFSKRLFQLPSDTPSTVHRLSEALAPVTVASMSGKVPMMALICAVAGIAAVFLIVRRHLTETPKRPRSQELCVASNSGEYDYSEVQASDEVSRYL